MHIIPQSKRIVNTMLYCPSLALSPFVAVKVMDGVKKGRAYLLSFDVTAYPVVGC